MSTWRRPFALRLSASLLLIAALVWALLPPPAQAHDAEAQQDGDVALVLALAVAPHEVGLALSCGLQSACAPTLVVQPVTTTPLSALWRLLRVRSWDDRRTHLHRHVHEPPPPRPSA